MKRFLNFLLMAALCCSCGINEDCMQGAISVSFSALSPGLFKSGGTVFPDTNSFILTIESSRGDLIYKGEFCSLPESLVVDPGSYTVSAVSAEFTAPAFDVPQWGDSQVVVVPSGQSVHVELICRQVNCGVRLHIDEKFLAEYPGSVLFVKSEEGKLMYSYSEKRTAYFLPGLVSLMMTTGSKDEILLSRMLEAGQILDLTVKTAGIPQSGESAISIKVDTARTYLDEIYTIGETGQKGDSADNPMSVSQARSSAGSKDVWVEGFVVAGDLTQTGADFSGPFTSRTNFAIGQRKSTLSKDQCLSVELKSGKVRDALNLVDNPDIYEAHVVLKGDIETAYFGIPGLKNVKDYFIR